MRSFRFGQTLSTLKHQANNSWVITANRPYRFTVSLNSPSFGDVDCWNSKSPRWSELYRFSFVARFIHLVAVAVRLICRSFSRFIQLFVLPGNVVIAIHAKTLVAHQVHFVMHSVKRRDKFSTNKVCGFEQIKKGLMNVISLRSVSIRAQLNK